MKLRVTLSLFALLLTSSISGIYAENKYSLNDTIPLAEVAVVSATKTEVNRNQIPLTISVVDRETIDASTETGVLSILSEQVPGLFVTERGVTGYGVSSGSAGTVNIHGVGGGNRVLMLFDGQPNWAGIFGHHLPDAYVASDAERVEVIRGPGSLLYGSNAMGGIINVITRKATENGIHGRGRILYGSYDTWKFRGSAGYKKDKFNAYISLNHDQSDGQRENSAFYINNGYIKLGYEITDNWNVNGDAIIAGFKVNNPGAVDAPAVENWAKAVRSTYSVSLNNTYGKMNGSLQMFYNDGNHKINDGWRNGEPRPYLFRSSDFNKGIALFESFRLIEGNLFTVGFDAKQWGGHAWNDSINGKIGEIIDKKVNEFAGYAVVQQTLFDKLTVNAGVRLENNEGYGNEWIPQGGIAYQLSNQTSFKASASKGFRSPNLRELYLYMPANPDLKPEEMNNFDFSWLQSLWNNKIQLELTAYYAHGKNLITTAMVDGKPLNVNTDKFTNKGIDFAFTYHILPALKASGNYSFLDSDIRIAAAPKHKAFLSINWSVNKFTVAPNFQYINGLYLGTANDTEVVDHYALLNCKVSYKATEWIHLFVNGENLTDTSYQTYLGFPMPGIVILGGFDVKF
ncbi:MAG: TonB-dependent receptor [Candidatus Symbiothrix sp.]|jgi:iron complex outermembrane receptor protein|nr:TonB-dependent receptor [Candidatus Symbiothrix sp.]